MLPSLGLQDEDPVAKMRDAFGLSTPVYQQPRSYLSYGAYASVLMNSVMKIDRVMTRFFIVQAVGVQVRWH